MIRNLRAEGPAVVEWFARRAVGVTPVATSPSVLIVDESDIAGVVVRRLWHTGLRLTPGTQQGSGSTLVLQAEGIARVEFEGDTGVDIDAGAALGYPAASLPLLSSTQPTARIEVVAPQRLLDTPHLLPGADDSPVWRALASTVNSILNGDHRLGVAVESALGHAIESLCAALIAGRPGADAAAAGFRSAQATFAAAMRLVTQRAADPEFTVVELADSLQVSRQYLSRVFARHGCTPSAALRARRLELADALAAVGVPTHEVARRSGFSSTRALSQARRDREARG